MKCVDHWWKTKMSCISRFSSYHTVNALCFGYQNQPVNAINVRCSEKQKTSINSVGRMRNS